MKEIAISIISVALGAVITNLFNRRKYKAEVELNEVECAKKVVDLYKDALEGVQKELALAREEIGKLRQEVKDLTTLNRKLEKELKQFRKSTMNPLIFEDLVKENKEAFIAKVKEVSSYLGISPNWLMFVMWFETAHTLNSHVQNPIKATGLIQFMPDTAKGLGTNVEALKAMSNVEQLYYVQKHLARFKGQYKTFVDLYCAIFWPAAVGKPNTYRITSDQVAAQNPIFDINHDKDIEKSEIRVALIKQIPSIYKQYFL